MKKMKGDIVSKKALWGVVKSFSHLLNYLSEDENVCWVVHLYREKSAVDLSFFWLR